MTERDRIRGKLGERRIVFEKDGWRCLDKGVILGKWVGTGNMGWSAL